MERYLALARDIIDNGVDRGDRTGTGTRSVFGRQLRFDLSEGFPLLTTKKVFLRGIIHELLWFLSGSTDNNVLLENDVRIWNEWALEDGSLGSIYGKQWRSWQCPDGSTVDQIEQVIHQIRTKPHSRRLIVSAWNPADLPDEGISPQDNVRQGKMALAPCHTLFQFFVADGKLSCQLYQRSADHAIGVPFNIASYSLLLMLVADQTGYAPGEFIHTFGDVHLYHNHLNEQMIYKQLQRSPGPLPQMRILRTPESIDGYSIDDFELSGYDPHPAIKMPIAV